MTLLDIRKDLKTIKYYYAMKNVFDRNSKELMPRKIVETVHKYGKAINDSEGELYVFYTELYVNGATQTDLADYLSYIIFLKQMILKHTIPWRIREA